MKRTLIPRLFVLVVTFCIVSLILQATYLVSADEAAAPTQCVLDDKGECKPLSWIDEMGDKTKQFLQEKVFGQKQLKVKQHSFLTKLYEDKPNEEGENPFFKLLDRLTDWDKETPTASPSRKEKNNDSNDVVSLLIQKSRMLTQEEQSQVGLEFLGLLQEALKKAAKQLKDTFGNVLNDIDASIPVSMLYYLAEEDAKKNPSWKRRQHRFYAQVSKQLVLELHDALYLAQLAYVDKLEEFREGLAKFQENAWELVFGTTDSTPTMPSHFLLIHKNLSPLSDPALTSVLPWEGQKESEIEVTLVVRGTKHLADMVSDAMLEPTEYKGGIAHGGILTSGKELAKKYAPKLKEILKHSGRDKIRLFIVGHSLGAGAGAIAAMELNELDFINVEAVGFGCPSLLSEDLSISTKAYITTVVTDADIIPRMSGASVMNMLLKLIEFDWTDSALEDIGYSLERARSVLPFGDILPNKEKVMKWSEDFLKNEIKPKIGAKKHDRVQNELIPPGECIHFFRDGVGFSGSFTPCSFFNEIDIARTLIDDHLIMPGYHRALITFMRDLELDYNFDFAHDIASIPV